MTARKSASTAEQSEARRQRYEARSKVEKKLGRKLKKGEQVDHVKPKLGKKKYDNSTGNLKATSKSNHKKKMSSSKSETGGRPKGSKDSVIRKKKVVKKKK